MGWENRLRGGRYYTRSRKVGGRVVREYVGTGLIAELSAQMDAEEREERVQARAAVRAERDRDRAQEKALTDYCRTVGEVLAEALLAAGYHKHKGQWRRKRGTEERGNRPG
jgi:hypothetical protein